MNGKILIVDDSNFMRNLLKNILIKNGFNQILEAGNGKEAEEVYKKENPNLVLLDIIMPEQDGIATLKNLGAKANVVMITAVGQEAMISQAKSLGARGYIVKPFQPKQILSVLEKIL